MKRSCIALTLLLATLAFGLALSGPRSCQAGSPGQLAFAIAVETSDETDPLVSCPLACCPWTDECDRCEAAFQAESVKAELDYLDALVVDDAEMELNAAQSTDRDDEELAVDDYDYDDSYYGYEDYGDEYADEYGPSWSDAADEVAAQEMELNAAQTNDVAKDSPNWDEYYSEYADEYYEDEDYYDSDDYDPYACVPGEDAATGDVKTEACFDNPCTSQISSDDLVLRDSEVETTEKVDAANETAEVCPYDCYGHQVGDDDSYYQSYYEDYYSDQYDSGDEVEDYEQYYSQEYYDSLEDDAAADEAAAADEYMSDYDEAYDEAVYGPAEASNQCDPAPAPDWAAMFPAEETLADVVDDLPWADEAQFGESTPAATADAPARRTYGCDYADAYLRAVDEQGVPYDEAETTSDASQDAGEASATIESIDLPAVRFDAASVKSLPKVLNVARLASACGECVAGWTRSLAQIGPAIQVARRQLDEAAPLH